MLCHIFSGSVLEALALHQYRCHMHPRLTPTLVSLSLALSFVAPVAQAAMTRPIQTPPSAHGQNTYADFSVFQVYMPGAWTITKSDANTLLMTRGKTTVDVHLVPKDDCIYQSIRTRALKAWGTPTLDASKARIVTINLTRGNYKGFKWSEPDTTDPKQVKSLWCVAQDPRTAALITAMNVDKSIYDFIDVNLYRQFVVRSARR